MPLAGYAGREAPFESVASGLEANAVLLSCRDERVLFVAVDALYAGAALTDAVVAQARLHGLPAANVVVSASHTHFAPATDPSKPAIGKVDQPWLGELCRRLSALVERVCSSDLVHARVERLRADVPLNVNRRRRWRWPTVSSAGVRWRPTTLLAPAPEKRRDTDADLFRILDERGQVLACLWKYACHPVGAASLLSVDAEYPGRVRRRLRPKERQDIPIVFWQGFAGDVRPWIPERTSVARRLAAMLRGPGFAPPDQDRWSGWCERLADEVEAQVARGRWRPVSPGIAVSGREIPLDDLLRSEGGGTPRPARAMSVQRVTLGNEVDLLFVSAEVCSPYMERLRGPRPTVFVGYTGDTACYLPTEEQVREGGYEADGFWPYFGMKGDWLPGFDRRFEQVVLSTDQTGSSSIG
jgi:hypothetical protein